ncbi:hypothetical protein BH09BAC5_BH09BAC5_02360 [soil metagenome]
MNLKPKPKFDKRIFWDVDFEKLDYDVKARWVIVRVIERGDVEDIRQCRRFYGDDLVRKTLLETKFIGQGRIHLAAAIIDEPIQKFRCYISQQSNPTLFPF